MKIIEDLREHFVHYLALLVILNIAIGAFFLFSFNRASQAVIAVTLGVVYVLWGIIHHILSGDLHIKVVLEYILFALLANLVILSLLFRA